MIRTSAILPTPLDHQFGPPHDGCDPPPRIGLQTAPLLALMGYWAISDPPPWISVASAQGSSDPPIHSLIGCDRITPGVRWPDLPLDQADFLFGGSSAAPDDGGSRGANGAARQGCLQEVKQAWKRRVSQMTYRPKARYRRNFEPQPVPLGSPRASSGEYRLQAGA